MKTIPKLWLESLETDSSWIERLCEKDRDIMYEFGLATYAIRFGKYRNDLRKQRLKLMATKNQMIECYLYKFLLRKSIIISIIVKGISDYWENKNKYSYEDLMKELDEILNTPLDFEPKSPKEEICPNNCRAIGFGFCMCRKKNGDYYD